MGIAAFWYMYTIRFNTLVSAMWPSMWRETLYVFYGMKANDQRNREERSRQRCTGPVFVLLG